MPTIHVTTTKSYPVIIEAGALGRIAEFLLPLHPPCRVVLLSDDTVFPLYGTVLAAALEKAGYRPFCLMLPAGEAGKNWTVLGGLL